MGFGTLVTIDREGCISCGVCWASCPEFFEENANDNKSQVVETYRSAGSMGEGEAPPQILQSVREAAEACPVTVIAVE